MFIVFKCKLPGPNSQTHTASLTHFTTRAGGLAFGSADNAALARICLEVSMRHDEQSMQKIWSNVQDVFSKSIDISTEIRTPDSFCSRRNNLQRVVQKYLAYERAYNSKPASSETAEDAAENLMPH